jgi:peptidoglycan/LPS O-acetylase OafA/YrhL
VASYGDSSHQAFLRQRVFGSLDGIRAFSVMAVVWHHTNEFGGPRLFTRGFLGVDMFFVLSGFLIVTLLLRERDRKGQISLTDFYVRRTLRIFPVYYGLLVVLSLVFAVLPSSETGVVWFDELWILATYTANLFEVTTFMGIAWSLAAEEQFYLIWPSVERNRRSVIYACLGGALILSQAIQFRVFSAFGWPIELVLPHQMFLEVTFTPILLGVVLAHLLHHRATHLAVRRWVQGWWAAPGLAVGLLVFLALAPADLTGWPRLVAHLWMMGLLAACVVREDHGLSRVLSWRWLVRIGMVSYGIYLFHMLGRHVAGAVLGRLGLADVPGPFFVLTLAGTWAAAELSFRYFELPFLKLKSRFQRV